MAMLFLMIKEYPIGFHLGKYSEVCCFPRADQLKHLCQEHVPMEEGITADRCTQELSCCLSVRMHLNVKAENVHLDPGQLFLGTAGVTGDLTMSDIVPKCIDALPGILKPFPGRIQSLNTGVEIDQEFGAGVITFLNASAATFWGWIFIVEVNL